MPIDDRDAIRQLVATWMRATQAGDVDTVLSLMTDDVVFLVAGQPPMDKSTFEAAMRAQAAGAMGRFEGTNEIREIEVAGDWAFLWQALSVSFTPPQAPEPVRRAGHTLTVFRKGDDGRWRLARDANLLAAVGTAKA